MMRNRSYLLAIIFSLVVFSFSFAGEGNNDGPSIVTKVDTEAVEFGGRINVEVFADNAEGFEVTFPKSPSELGDFSLIRTYPIKDGSVKGHGPGMGYIMGVYSTGVHVIPPIRIEYRRKGVPEDLNAYSQQIPITVTSLLTGEDIDIKDIKGLIFFTSHLKLLLSILGGFVFAGVIAFVILWWKKKQEKNRASSKYDLPPHEIAYMELNRLRAKGLHERARVKEFYTILSDILRRYIEGRFRYNAPEMTTQEFIEKMKNSPLLRSEDKSKLEDFLTHCDMIKFAKFSATQLEMLDSFKVVENFVDQTRIVVKSEEEKV